jgi:Tol biopolymer transport system component
MRSLSRSWRTPALPAMARTACAGLLALGLGGCGDVFGPSEKDPPAQLLFLSHSDVAGYTPWYSQQTDIYRVNADGTGLQNLTQKPGHYSSLSLSPDGRSVAFHSNRAGGVTSQIFVMDVSGDNLRQLTRDNSGSSAPRWSPDGTRIAYQHAANGASHVFVMKADGSDPLVVSLGVTGSGCGSTGSATISLIGWQPNGRVMFSRHVCGQPYRFFTVNDDGSGLVEVLDMDLNRAYWSPDGSKVVYVSKNLDGLYVMNADGSGVRKLTEHVRAYLPLRVEPHFNSDYTPWSPDGKRLMFVGDTSTTAVTESGECMGTLFTYIINVDGSGLRQLDNFCGEFNEFNGWSPNGKQMAFTAARPSSAVPYARDVYVADADGSDVVNLTRTAHVESSAIWVRTR